MQYKIPVQIENEDPIVLWLSIRQLWIIIIWWGISYSLFNTIAPNIWVEVALIPSVLIFWFFIIVAIFKYYEMTFIPFILAYVRFKSNIEERKWIKWVDSFQPIDVGYLANQENKIEDKIDYTEKIDKIKELENKIHKI